MRALLYDPSNGACVTGGSELVARWKASSTQTLWCDFDEVSDEEREQILEGAFGLHPLAITDALRSRHPPKVERFGDTLFVILRGLDVETKDINFGYIGISVFIGPRFIVTRHTGVSLSIDWLWEEAQRERRLCTSPSQLFVALADRLVRRYLPILLALEPRFDALESEIFERPRDTLLSELTVYKSRLKQLRRIFLYHDFVLTRLAAYQDLSELKQQAHELIDVHDQVKRCESLSELFYGVAADLMDAYLATSAHRLNQVMKVLTIITVIFVPLSFMAGIYGMNFENMPELKSRSGYFVLLGIMATLVLGQLAFFRSRKWI